MYCWWKQEVLETFCKLIDSYLFKWQPTPAFLPGESYGRRSLMGYSPEGHKESDMTEQLSTIPQYKIKCFKKRNVGKFLFS